MNKTQRALWIYFLILVLSVIPAAAQKRPQISPLDSVLSRFPASSSEERDSLAGEFLGLGEESVLKACTLLRPSGPVSDAQVRYALHASSQYVMRGGADLERSKYARTLIKALKAEGEIEVKAFLIRQLRLVGKEESVKPLSNCLLDPALCDPAAQALVSIGSPGVEKLFVKTIKKVKNSSKITLIKSLGEMRSRESVNEILPFMENADDGLRRAARFALANIGDPRAETVLERTLIADSAYERNQAVADYLLFARRLGEAGMKEKAVSIFRAMIQNYSAGVEEHISCSALRSLFDLLAAESLQDLISALDSPKQELRALALSLADQIPGREATELWLEKAESLPVEIKAEVIEMLGRRGDPASIPFIRKSLKSGDPVLRSASITAASALDKEIFFADMISILPQAGDEDRLRLKNTFLAMGKDNVVPGLVHAFPRLEPSNQVMVVEVLAERRASEHRELAFSLVLSDEEDVRRPALTALENLVTGSDVQRLIQMLLQNKDINETVLIQNALAAACLQVPEAPLRADSVLEALEKAGSEDMVDLIRVLPRIGGARALERIESLLQARDSKIETAAVAALSQWQDISAAPSLLMLAAESESDKYSYLAVQGYVRLAARSDMDPDRKWEVLSKIRPLISSSGETKLFLAGVGSVKSYSALQAALEYVDAEDLREDAVHAVLRIVMPEPEAEGLKGERAAAALDRIFGMIENEFRREEVEIYMKDILLEEGFKSLFNGWNLQGWVGDVVGYVAENGSIVIHPDMGSGNLYTSSEYSDFIFRFDFKLSPGANNGLGIRAPLEGDAAYMGMEIQILDNTAETYAELQPYQYHGSVYGVVPAKRGFLRPVGEWNREEVTVRGRRVTVKLNGVIIVDADLDDVSAGGTMDGRDHPGLKRSSGHIGFLGHGSRVEFRNIFIRDLT